MVRKKLSELDRVPLDLSDPDAGLEAATDPRQAGVQAARRRECSAEALRANLKRRKAQERARTSSPTGLDND